MMVADAIADFRITRKAKRKSVASSERTVLKPTGRSGPYMVITGGLRRDAIWRVRSSCLLREYTTNQIRPFQQSTIGHDLVDAMRGRDVLQWIPVDDS